MKVENYEVFDDTHTRTSDLIRSNFTRKIALNAATCTNEFNFIILKCYTVGCQIRET